MANTFSLLFPYATGLCRRCTRCSADRLFVGLLTISEWRFDCDLDFSSQDNGDHSAVFLIFMVGPIVTGLAFWFAMSVGPPLWLHIVFWFSVITVGSVALLRLFNTTLVALRFRHMAGEPGTRTFE